MDLASNATGEIVGIYVTVRKQCIQCSCRVKSVSVWGLERLLVDKARHHEWPREDQLTTEVLIGNVQLVAYYHLELLEQLGIFRINGMSEVRSVKERVPLVFGYVVIGGRIVDCVAESRVVEPAGCESQLEIVYLQMPASSGYMHFTLTQPDGERIVSRLHNAS